jgi:hypothetical protein
MRERERERERESHGENVKQLRVGRCEHID